MLKFLILFAVLVNIAACHKSDPKFCAAEAKRFYSCTGSYNNFTRGVFEANKKLIESSSTVAPLGSQLGPEFKKMLKCIGDLECKGERKQIKFQIDTITFYSDRVTDAQQCIEGNDINQSLRECVALHKTFPLPKGFSSTVVPCVQQVLEGTDCSTAEKEGLERGARAVADLYDQLDLVFADKDYMKNFDLKFDPRNYGL
ncbi:hypothetical protein B9Z55_018215 [Caenorhabditis nigoni]|uniref:DUF19 domain-containing protein n=1 Tax=Caenorhabditis nigoni TaxID=1611254 RepID=A0A2G5TD48_9PELO|nr:hypothetical protein B9Z55_018215 [Caenorhabditis nigoni]